MLRVVSDRWAFRPDRLPARSVSSCRTFLSIQSSCRSRAGVEFNVSILARDAMSTRSPVRVTTPSRPEVAQIGRPLADQDQLEAVLMAETWAHPFRRSAYTPAVPWSRDGMQTSSDPSKALGSSVAGWDCVPRGLIYRAFHATRAQLSLQCHIFPYLPTMALAKIECCH